MLWPDHMESKTEISSAASDCECYVTCEHVNVKFLM